MLLSRYLILLIAILVSSHPAVCIEIAYAVNPNGEKPVGYANITEYNGTDKVSFTVSARGPDSTSSPATRLVASIKDEINTKINRGNELVREEGLNLVANKSGAQRIDQICSIYDYMVGNWIFVSDWKGLDEFQYSNYTLKKGGEVGSSGKGDCDDFSILLASLIESIGGTPRIIFAYSPDGGHAYTEVYLGKKNDSDVDRMLTWLKTAYKVNDINIHIDPNSSDVWLNMDWWRDPGGATRPGGPFYQADKHIPMYDRDDEDKTPLTPIENLLPVPLFNYNPIQPEVDEQIIFDASESNDPDGKIVDYEWDFGDGDSSHGITKSVCRHSYSSSGKFQANLTVTDNEGGTGEKTSEVIVEEPLPEAIGTYSPGEPKVGEVITFDASQSKDKRGRIVDYEWDFDDGYLGKRVSIDHQYSRSSTYNVKLTVTNDRGVKDSSIIAVTVSEKIEAEASKSMENQANETAQAVPAQKPVSGYPYVGNIGEVTETTSGDYTTPLSGNTTNLPQ
jgi:PKD repeat protein